MRKKIFLAAMAGLAAGLLLRPVADQGIYAAAHQQQYTVTCDVLDQNAPSRLHAQGIDALVLHRSDESVIAGDPAYAVSSALDVALASSPQQFTPSDYFATTDAAIRMQQGLAKRQYQDCGILAGSYGTAPQEDIFSLGIAYVQEGGQLVPYLVGSSGRQRIRNGLRSTDTILGDLRIDLETLKQDIIDNIQDWRGF